MSGNVREWCYDLGDSSMRACRGGCFSDSASYAIVCYSRYMGATFKSYNGFRVARSK